MVVAETCMLVLVSLAVLLALPETKVSRTIGCRAGERLSSLEGNDDKRRLVSIGDVHGSLIGLHELLFKAGLTVERNSCEWHPDTRANGGVLFVQNGDIVDRGPNASEAWLCLKHLQDTAPAHDSEVIRLLGNHELWWLTGQLSYRNKKSDTKQKVEALVTLMKEEILSGAVKGAHSTVKDGLPLIFIHAGLRPEMISKLRETVPTLKNPSGNGEESALIAEYINQQLLKDVQSCGRGMALCKLDDVVYSAGPERGGNQLGGPYWTDFSVLEKAHSTQVEQEDGLTDFVQVVGHTVELNEIRATRGLGAICTDAGMMYGGRAFLELVDGRFITYEKEESRRKVAATAFDAKWYRRDLTALACAAY
jgi:hypothetical protein